MRSIMSNSNSRNSSSNSNSSNSTHPMLHSKPGEASRREFLRTGARLSLLGSAAPFALNLSGIGAASAQSATDYKALVCVFLFGGNDHFNSVIPYDPAEYAVYRTARSTIARTRESLLPLRTTSGQAPLAMPPELAALAARYNGGQLAIVANVGPMNEPTTLAQYNAGSVSLPAKLFSHNDQQSTWQASAPEGAQFGWGGRFGDLLAANNGNATFTCMSVSGNAVWLSGRESTQYQVTPAGAVAVGALDRASSFGSPNSGELLRRMVSQSTQRNMLERDYSAVVRRSLAAQGQLTSALAAAAPVTTVFPAGNPLAAQLRMVARSIAARQALGVKRQVFFVSMGGFDHHFGLNDSHPGLLQQVAEAMDAFYLSTVELGVQNQVTAFTASDFGRALQSNGDGSDHGWGGHHFVLGGAVRGGRVYGSMPTAALGTNTDAGQGRLLPTTAVDQYAGTLAGFMGLNAAQQLQALPNLGRFSSAGLDFV
jgi:uncharacterized protein (DUF1501 family)